MPDQSPSNAVRLTDPHTCGGDVSSECSTNVNAGGAPQATVGSQVVCMESGGLHTITTGAGRVYINGKRAARAMDQTACGGQLKAGTSRVCIGGLCVGGNPEKGTKACEDLQQGRPRDWGKHSMGDKQSGQNCGLESVRSLINYALGKGWDEGSFQAWAQGNKLADAVGGANAKQLSDLLTKQGLPADFVFVTPDDLLGDLAQNVEDGKGVIINVDSGLVWDEPASAVPHGVLVTGTERDAQGNLTRIKINDTNRKDGCGHWVPVETLKKALQTGHPGDDEKMLATWMVVTRASPWIR